jgi:hypothetical protein
MACNCDAIVSNLIDISTKLDNLGTMMTKISEIEARLNQIETKTQSIKQDTEGLGQTVKDNNNLIQNWIDRNVDSLENGVSRILDSLENGVNRIINGVDGLSSAIDLVSNIVSTGFQALTTIVNGVGSLLTGIRDFLSGGNSDDTERVLNAIGDVSNQVRQIPTNDAERILNALTGVGIEIERIANNTGDIILGNSQIYETVRLIPTNDAERILNALVGMDQILRSHSDSLADIIRRLIEGVNVDLSPVLSAIGRTEDTVRFEANKILAALALIKLTDLVGSILNGIKDILHQDKVDILEILANLTTLIQAIKGNEPVDLSPVLSAIDRIPTNDAERVLNALTAVRETQSYHSDQQAEIIRRLAIQHSDILNQLNETKNIINETNNQTNVDLSPVLNAIERTEGTVRGEATKILLAIAALKLSDLLGGLFNTIREALNVDKSEILGSIADLITIVNAIRGNPELERLLNAVKQDTSAILNEFKSPLGVTVDLSSNCSDESNSQEYANPGMKGIERMLQGVVAKLEIMENNAGKGFFPIVFQPPTPMPTEANPNPEAPEAIEFCSVPAAIDFLIQQKLPELIEAMTEDIEDIDKKIGDTNFLRPLSLTAGEVEIHSKQEFIGWAFEQFQYKDINSGTDNRVPYIPSGILLYLDNFPNGRSLRVPRSIYTVIDLEKPGTYERLITQTQAFNWACRQFELSTTPSSLPSNWLTKIRNLPQTNRSETPVSVPRDYFQDAIVIDNLSEYLTWQERQFEEILGGWATEITIDDADLTTEGNQPQTIRLPNMAAAVAEIAKLSIQGLITNEALLQVGVRSMIEAGQAKIEAIRAARWAESNAEYFGYEVKDVPGEVSLSYSPPTELEKNEKLDDYDNLAKLLQPKLVKVPFPDNKEKNPFSVELGKLLHAAAIVRAVFWEDAPRDGIGDRMKELAQRANSFVSNGVTPPPTDADGETEDDFDLFLNRVERGFIDEPGVTDAINPYGREYDRRPRIRRIGEQPREPNG